MEYWVLPGPITPLLHYSTTPLLHHSITPSLHHSLPMAFCTYHPGIEASGGCARCGQPFCDACLVEILGQRFCGPCRDVRLAEMQGFGVPGRLPQPVFAGTGKVDLGRWFGAGIELIKGDIVAFALAALLGGLVTLLTCGILYVPMQCGLYMMVFRKMGGGRVEPGHVFDGFRRAGNGVLAYLVLLGIGLVIFLVAIGPLMALQFYAASRNNPALALGAQGL